MRTRHKILTALAAAAALLTITAGGANATTTASTINTTEAARTTPTPIHAAGISYWIASFTCTTSTGYRFVDAQYWIVNEHTVNPTVPTNFTLDHQDWSTSPYATVNRVEFMWEESTPDQLLYAMGGTSASLNDVPASGGTSPNVFGGSSNTFNSANGDTYHSIVRQHMNVYGLGYESSTQLCVTGHPVLQAWDPS